MSASRSLCEVGDFIQASVFGLTNITVGVIQEYDLGTVTLVIEGSTDDGITWGMVAHPMTEVCLPPGQSVVIIHVPHLLSAVRVRMIQVTSGGIYDVTVSGVPARVNFPQLVKGIQTK